MSPDTFRPRPCDIDPEWPLSGISLDAVRWAHRRGVDGRLAELSATERRPSMTASTTARDRSVHSSRMPATMIAMAVPF